MLREYKAVGLNIKKEEVDDSFFDSLDIRYGLDPYPLLFQTGYTTVKKIEFDKVAAIESRGFVFASTVSYQLEKPFILLRKKNKLPAEVHSVDFQLEYGTATIEVHKDSIEKGEKILIIDDLIATGGTAEAAAKIVEISGGKVAGFIFVINLFDLPGEKLLKEKKYIVESLIRFPGH